MSALEIYVVGGAVRDTLLGQGDAGDLDWVVVGATPTHMVSLGFVPVGSDFPVFIHPNTGHEFALARTERKTSTGYQGFSFYAAPDVSLAQDLARRDLTVNAMAMAAPTASNSWSRYAVTVSSSVAGRASPMMPVTERC